ncbi:MAG: PIN domain nuclease [Chloroflexota bacterium]|nr:PIN domain nuclease [Chloroflexota bacterium]
MVTGAADGEAASRPRYLADKSALVRLGRPEVGAVLEPLLLAGEVATCGVVELEVLYSARSHQDLVRTRATRALAFPLVPVVQADFDRAADVMEALAGRGQHRAVGLPDLLIAAVAERAGLTVIHYVADYDLVAAVTGQPTRWIVPRGSVL